MSLHQIEFCWDQFKEADDGNTTHFGGTVLIGGNEFAAKGNDRGGNIEDIVIEGVEKILGRPLEAGEVNELTECGVLDRVNGILTIQFFHGGDFEMHFDEQPKPPEKFLFIVRGRSKKWEDFIYVAEAEDEENAVQQAFKKMHDINACGPEVKLLKYQANTWKEAGFFAYDSKRYKDESEVKSLLDINGDLRGWELVARKSAIGGFLVEE